MIWKLGDSRDIYSLFRVKGFALVLAGNGEEQGNSYNVVRPTSYTLNPKLCEAGLKQLSPANMGIHHSTFPY